MAPMPPMKLMMPLACERLLDGVISGIRATTGVRHSAMLNNRVVVPATKRGSTAAMGIMPKASAEIGAPMRINGIRLPMGERNLSDQAPTGGWMNRAARLSSVMKKPIHAGAKPKRSDKKMGTKAL